MNETVNIQRWPPQISGNFQRAQISLKAQLLVSLHEFQLETSHYIVLTRTQDQHDHPGTPGNADICRFINSDIAI